MQILFLIIGMAAGAGAVWLVLRARVEAAERAAAHERERADEKARYAEQVESRLGETIQAAAARAVQGNNEEFLALAGQRLTPVQEQLDTLGRLLREIENTRESAYGSITEQVEGLARVTSQLSGALQKPGTRGRWGEIGLRRIVELAGMVERCHFTEQPTIDGDDGRIRPDLVVHLPGGIDIPVDAKAPHEAFARAVEADRLEDRDRFFDEHAKALREHALALGKKGYPEHFDRAPDFVVMFVPVEAWLAVALERRPDLQEEAFENGVILAGPSMLIGLLKVIAEGWRQREADENAKQVEVLARDLHKRLATMADPWVALGERLRQAVGAYNKAVGSLEGRVLPAARKFEQLGMGSQKTIPKVSGVEEQPRPFTAPEMTELDRRVVELGDRAPVAIDDDDYGTLGGAAAERR